MSYRCGRHARRGRQPRTLVGPVHQIDDGVGQRCRVALRHDPRVAAVGQDVERGRRHRWPRSACPIASASKAVSGVPSQSDGNTLRSNALSTRGHVSREPDEHESIAEAERARLRLERFAQRALADEEESRVRPLRRARAARPRPDTSCPSTRAAASRCRSRNRRARCRARAGRPRSRRPSARG